MALQSSGAISLNDLKAEFSGTTPVELDDYYKGGSLVPTTATNSSVPTSGQISIGDFYGAADVQATQDYSIDWSLTTTPSQYTAGPINIYYRRSVIDWYFTATELTAAGMSSGAVISKVTFYVASAVDPSRSINDWKMGMANLGTGTSVSTVTQVFSKSGDFTEAESTGDMVITLSTPFTWNGGNLGFRCAWCQNDTGWTGQGILRVNTGQTLKYSRTDSSGCYTLSNTASSSTSARPVMKLTATAATPTTIGTITTSGPTTALTGTTSGPYTYTAAYSGNASNPSYNWYINSGGWLVSQSGNTGVFKFSSTGTNVVWVDITDTGASDSPKSHGYSVSASLGTLYIGTAAVTGATNPVISTSEVYTVGNITDAVSLGSSLVYTWSVAGTGSTSGNLSFTGQGNTAITVTMPSAAGTYSVSCTISSTNATDSPYTATLAVSVATSTSTLTTVSYTHLRAHET